MTAVLLVSIVTGLVIMIIGATTRPDRTPRTVCSSCRSSRCPGRRS